MSTDKALLRPGPLPVPFARPVAARVQEAAAASPPLSPPLQLHVERLVLHGLPLLARDAGRVESAFRQELEQRVAASPQRLRRLAGGAVDALRIDALNAPDRPLDSAHRGYPEQLGRALARALWRGLERGSGR